MKKTVKTKLDEALKAARRGDGKEAFEDLSAARFRLFDEDCYTERLISAFDDGLDVAWRLWRGKLSKKEAASKLEGIVERIERLIEKPEGEKARPPARVKTERDARLWDMAKWLVDDEYPDVKEDTERYWKLVSGIFTRLKLRLGGMESEDVDKIVNELKEKYGKLPPAGENSKARKELEELKMKYVEKLLKGFLDNLVPTIIDALRRELK